MNVSRLIATGVSLAIPLTTISAQSDSASSTRTAPAKWEFSLGTDARDLDLSPANGMHGHFVGTLTRNWQSAGSRFSRQLSLMAGADASHRTGTGACYGCGLNKQYAGLTAGLAADLFHAWRFTPYLHTGAGLYYTHLGAFNSQYLLLNHEARNDLSFGINGGLGIKARFFSHEFFIDQTLHAFDVNRIDRGAYPLSIGIRW